MASRINDERVVPRRTARSSIPFAKLSFTRTGITADFSPSTTDALAIRITFAGFRDARADPNYIPVIRPFVVLAERSSSIDVDRRFSDCFGCPADMDRDGSFLLAVIKHGHDLQVRS